METFDVDASSARRAKAFCDEFVVEKRRPRFLFGRNKYAVSIADRIDVDGFVDDFTADPNFRGKPVAKLEALPASSMVVNCVAGGRPITAQRRIDSLGYDQLDYYAFLKHSGLTLEPIDYWIGFPEHFDREHQRYSVLRRSLKDALSREVLARLISFRLTYDLDHMRIFSYTQARQYFEHFIEYGEQEFFADIGAFDGFTSQEFARRWPAYKGIHLFEPNPGNLEIAKAKLTDPRIHFVPAAVGEAERTVRLDPSGSGSRITPQGAVEVRMEPLDKYQDVAFTFLKMDIEGGEAAAISGAENVIRNHHPKMAISVYHRPGDFVDIPERVLEIRDDYDIFLRHYTEGFMETIMYFIPKN